MEEGTVSYLWYIIPGALALAPIFLIYSQFLEYEFLFILLSFIVGFLIHTFYRIWYYYRSYGKRKALVYFKGKIRGFDKKHLDIDNFEPRNLDKLYNNFIWSNPDCKSYINHISKKEVILTASYTIIIASVIGVLFTLFLCCYCDVNHFLDFCRIDIVICYLSFYAITIILLSVNSYNLEIITQDHEKRIIDNVLKSPKFKEQYGEMVYKPPAPSSD